MCACTGTPITKTQCFTLMTGISYVCTCHRKPTLVTYNYSDFVVDLSSVHCIDDLHADNNGILIHRGKFRKSK